MKSLKITALSLVLVLLLASCGAKNDTPDEPAVDHAVAVLMHQRGDGARRALELHKAVSRPAAGIK